MKEIKQEVIHRSFVTKYEANDGTIFESAEECKRYESSAEAVLLSNYRQIEVKFVSEYEMFDVGSEEYFLSVIRPRTEKDVNLIMQLWCLFNKHYTNDDRLQEIREQCWKAVNTRDYLIIGRGCEYDGYDVFWIFGTLTDKLNKIIKICDPGSIVEIKDDLTYPDKE